jgi:hypothetical protein
MTKPQPRLHKEFFNIIMDVEDIFRYKAKIADRVFRPIIETAVFRYLDESQQPFGHYIIAEIESRPSVSMLVSPDVLEEISLIAS